jgi:succinate dehydrogenase / fumarate reductase membrane anchor subunit
VSVRPGKASRHWRNQRMTALALIPLGLWFIASLLRQPSLEHEIVAGWFARPLQALLAALLGGALLWHSMQGVEVVLEDDVRGRALAVTTGIARIIHLAAALVLAYAIYRLARGGAP